MMGQYSWLVFAGVSLVIGFLIGKTAYSIFNAAQPAGNRGSKRVSLREIAFGLGFVIFFVLSMRVTFWLVALLRK